MTEVTEDAVEKAAATWPNHFTLYEDSADRIFARKPVAYLEIGTGTKLRFEVLAATERQRAKWYTELDGNPVEDRERLVRLVTDKDRSQLHQILQECVRIDGEEPDLSRFQDMPAAMSPVWAEAVTLFFLESLEPFVRNGRSRNGVPIPTTE